MSARVGLLAALLVVVPRVVVAQDDTADVDIQLFRPSHDDLGTPGTPSAEVRPQLSPTFGFWTHYARSPLLRQKQDGTVVQEVVARQVIGEVTVDVPLLDYLSVRAAFPWAFFQHGSVWNTTTPIATSGIGDLSLGAKMNLLTLGPGAFGLSLDGSFPTGDETSYLGERNMTLRALLHGSHTLGPFFFGGYGGVRVRDGARIGDLVVGNELLYGVGGSYVLPLGISWSDIGVYGDVYGRAGIENLFGRTSVRTAPIIHAVRASPLEADVGLSWRIRERVTFLVAAGTGVLGGYGSPLYRVTGGVQVTLPAPAGDRDGDGVFDDEDGCPDDPEDKDGWQDADGCPDLDDDGDGLRDTEDGCPRDPEDNDGFEDDDGCPDLDNDKDGRADASDGCPLEPEDMDDFEDQDGCPDVDDDKDGIVDVADKCRLEPEDKDDFEDDDGCPDLDDDHDGVADVADACRLVPEDKDGFEDDDGCPELDNDKDGIADEADACPVEPETINGFEDDDGCPDQGKQVVILRAERIEITETIEFDFQKATLKPAGKALLDQVAQVLRGHASIKKVSVEGHTDNVGNDAFNLKLSKDRAEAVLRYLVDEKGIEQARLVADGFGETRPIEPNTSEAGRAKNRRVEFLILEQEGADPADPPADAAAQP